MQGVLGRRQQQQPLAQRQQAPAQEGPDFCLLAAAAVAAQVCEGMWGEALLGEALAAFCNSVCDWAWGKAVGQHRSCFDALMSLPLAAACDIVHTTPLSASHCSAVLRIASSCTAPLRDPLPLQVPSRCWVTMRMRGQTCHCRQAAAQQQRRPQEQ